jgi:predicted amino acid racemase
MFLERTRRRNPELIRSAVELHQAGRVPPNTFVFDADRFEANGAALRAAADRHGLRLYFMSKQHGRNPELFRRVVAPGAKETVSVSIEDARILHRHGIGLGHLGNLVQVPRADLPAVVSTYRPEVVSVFTVTKAEQLAAAARAAGREQAVLLRVHAPDDTLFPGMEGGFMLDALDDAVTGIAALEGLRIAGVSTFPALRYDASGTRPEPTANLATLGRARDLLERRGIAVEQVNAPGNTASNTMEIFAAHGVTHVEPGSALTASTTFHLYDDDLPEQPAMVYLTEVSHMWDEQAYVFGGGFFVDDPPVPEREAFVRKALAGSDPDAALEQEVTWMGIGARGGGSFAAIDYHGIVDTGGRPVQVGDSVVFGFRAQLFMTRAYAAVVEGLAVGRPRLVGVWDWAGHRVGGDPE